MNLVEVKRPINDRRGVSFLTEHNRFNNCPMRPSQAAWGKRRKD